MSYADLQPSISKPYANFERVLLRAMPISGAAEMGYPRHFRFPRERPKRRQKTGHYSITSSARARSVGGISNPSAFAALRLMINSSLFGNSTGRSDGLAPLRILTT